MSKKTILLAEDDDSIRLVTTRFLEDSGYEVRSVDSLKKLWKLIESSEGEVLITDVMMPDGELFDILPQIIELRSNLPVIVISAKNNLQTAISATQQGAYEYLPKPFDLQELVTLVSKAIDYKKNKKEKPNTHQTGDKQLIVGRSMIMQDLYKSIARLSQNDLTVMIYGESGTGKEAFGRQAALVSLLLGPAAAAYLKKRPHLNPATFCAAYIADDIVYGAGLWAGCIDQGTLVPVTPRLYRQIPTLIETRDQPNV